MLRAHVAATGDDVKRNFELGRELRKLRCRTDRRWIQS